jgi:hypothetical protein
MVHAVQLDSVSIIYVASVEASAIYVLNIGSRKLQADLSWLREAARKGEIDDLLLRLGIDKAEILDDAHSPFLN